MSLDAAMIAAARDRAESLYSKGKFREALATYEKLEEYGRKDPRIYMRMGDIAGKLGAKDSVISFYKKGAESFLSLGFTLKAVAVCKMILALDPDQKEVQASLAKLHGGQGPAARPEVPRTPLFSGLAEDEFLEVLKKVRSVECVPGAYIFREGDPGDSIFLIAEGEVEVIGSAKDSSKVTLARLPEGSVFGEFGFFLGSRRTMDVRAVTKATVLELTKADLTEIISRYARVEAVLFDFYKERVVDTLIAMTELFRPLTAEDRKDVLARVTRSAWPMGEDIVKEGDVGQTMYIIKAGEVVVWVKGTDGGRNEVARLGPGDFFGEVALATSRPRVATVTAASGLVELVEIGRPVIRDLAFKYPEIKQSLEKVIRERVIDAMRARKGVLII
ncbi:Cyclic AMP receptor protein [uncultured bacterium]|nr:Cyclic AMP receptor protein [uncultured bacterium]